jgi:hypothetical protein
MNMRDEEKAAFVLSDGEVIHTSRPPLTLAIEQAEKQLGNSADEPPTATAPFDSSPTLPAVSSDCPEFQQRVAKLNALFANYSYGYWFFTAQSLSGYDKVHPSNASAPVTDLLPGPETPPNSVRPLKSLDKGERS